MKRRGDVSLSFGTIFSIIIIIAIISVAIYALTYFVGLKKCTEISLFYKNLQDHVDEAWNADSVSDTFSASLPSSIDSVCFGNLSQAPRGKEYDALKLFSRQNANLFMYPPKGACETKYILVKHVRFDSFFCVPLESSQVTIKFEKTSFDPLVTLRQA